MKAAHRRRHTSHCTAAQWSQSIPSASAGSSAQRGPTAVKSDSTACWGRFLSEIPCVSLGNARKYAAMMQYSLTEESIRPEEIAVYHEKAEQIRKEISDGINYHGTWEAEQRFFRAVSEGTSINANSLPSAFSHGKIGELSDNPIRQLKDMLIVKTVLCSRAAMIGGVSPDGSYSLSDYFIQQIENQNSIAALTDLSSEILQTFLYRSRQAKKEQGYSAPIRKVMEYVQDHIQEKILLKDVAAEAGYAEYYLSSKFKKEVGISINSYVTECKERTEPFRPFLDDFFQIQNKETPCESYKA